MFNAPGTSASISSISRSVAQRHTQVCRIGYGVNVGYAGFAVAKHDLALRPMRFADVAPHSAMAQVANPS
jgi:hypothetical protein